MGPTKRWLRILALLASTALLAGIAGPVAAQGPAGPGGFTATSLQPDEVISVDIAKAARTADGRVAVIVRLADASVASYTGGVKGYAATNPKARGQKTLDLKSTDTTRYRAYLHGKQAAFTGRLALDVPSARVTGRYDLVVNAVSALVPQEDLASLAALPGVKAVYPDVALQLDTDRSPSFIGATTVWSQLGGQEGAGEGVIVGVIDTGIWPEHPSFSDPDPSGKAYAAPPAAPDGSRLCQFSGGANPGNPFTCNHKLIAAGRYMATYQAVTGLVPGEYTSARDDDGHGTHTASTAAGNYGVEASIFGVDRGSVSGIAPRAWVEAFKVCGIAGCYSSDSMTAIEAAIGDGVNVINFSISGGANPYSDAVELAFLDAYNAGIFVAASAGNAGPTSDTTDHRGPWVTTVAASTHDRAFTDTVTLTSSDGASLSLSGTSLTAGVGPLPVVVDPDPLCGPAASGAFTGAIVVCKRGNYGRAEKGYNVLQAGAAGMILYNQSPGVTDLETDNHYLPASHLQYAGGQAVLAFLAGHPGVQATISAGSKATAQGDVMASFSSRGGPAQSLGVSKPDITAPGVQILAGASPQHVAPANGGVALGPQGELFQAIAGTSMSSPHIAGSGALLKALHPSWTPGQIKSALMTTAKTSVVKEDGTTPATAFDDGSGRVDLTKAGSPGLTFDASGTDYVVNQSRLYLANYPSIYVPAMPGGMTLTRTARSVLTTSSKWRVTATSGAADFRITVPTTIAVGAGASTAFSITLDAATVPLGETRTGTVTLTQIQGGTRVLHMPVTIVRGQAAVTLTKTCTPTDLAVGASTHCTLTATNPSFADTTYVLKDVLPSVLKVDISSVVGGTADKKSVSSSGTLPAAAPPGISVVSAPGANPAGGYLPLSTFGITPIGGMGDETIANFGVPAFNYGGEAWTRLGVVSDGYLVVGGGTSADVVFQNTNLPNPNRPNNIIAGFWSDLNVAFGGAVRIATITDGASTWIVVDFAAVSEYTVKTNTHTFEVWIGLSGNPNPNDITLVYGPSTGTGDGGSATVGAENRFGNRGTAVYYNGTGTLPTTTTVLAVNSTPGATYPKVVTFDAKAGSTLGPWTNCATLTSPAFYGTSYACTSGAIH